jgi:hypothetical protein
MLAKFSAAIKALFNSPYLDKADVAAAVSGAVVLFGLHLTSFQQAAAVTLIAGAYVVAHKLTN